MEQTDETKMDITENNLKTIHKYIPHFPYQCTNCIVNTTFDETSCDDCNEIYEETDGEEMVCDLHNGTLCYECFHQEKTYAKVIFNIIKQAFITHGSIAFIELNSTLNHMLIPDILDKLLVKCLEFPDRVLELIKLGANVDMDYKKFNPNFTLLSWCLYKGEYKTAKILIQHSDGSIFIHEDKFNITALASAISGYVSVNVYNNRDIEFLLENGGEISSIYLDKIGISGCEYGDKKYSGCNNHKWRRDRIKWLIKKGANYNIVNNTRLGCYLNYLNVLREFN
jgi:hypothetical protein